MNDGFDISNIEELYWITKCKCRSTNEILYDIAYYEGNGPMEPMNFRVIPKNANKERFDRISTLYNDHKTYNWVTGVTFSIPNELGEMMIPFLTENPLFMMYGKTYSTDYFKSHIHLFRFVTVSKSRLAANEAYNHRMNMIRHIENMPRWFKDMIVVLLKPANMLYNYGEYDIKLRMGDHVPGLKDTRFCNVEIHAEVFKYPTINGVPLEGVV